MTKNDLREMVDFDPHSTTKIIMDKIRDGDNISLDVTAIYSMRTHPLIPLLPTGAKSLFDYSKLILYADKYKESIQSTLFEAERKFKVQLDYPVLIEKNTLIEASCIQNQIQETLGYDTVVLIKEGHIGIVSDPENNTNIKKIYINGYGLKKDDAPGVIEAAKNIHKLFPRSEVFFSTACDMRKFRTRITEGRTAGKFVFSFENHIFISVDNIGNESWQSGESLDFFVYNRFYNDEITKPIENSMTDDQYYHLITQCALASIKTKRVPSFKTVRVRKEYDGQSPDSNEKYFKFIIDEIAVVSTKYSNFGLYRGVYLNRNLTNLKEQLKKYKEFTNIVNNYNLKSQIDFCVNKVISLAMENQDLLIDAAGGKLRTTNV